MTPSCPGPGAVKAAQGGFLPADLAAPGAYGHDALLAAGYDGDGERVAFVEFSDYRRADVDTFQACFGTSVPVTDVPVAGGTGVMLAPGEVAMNVQVAVAAAPRLDHAFVYQARGSLSIASVVNEIVADLPGTGVTVISISWGQCERLLAPARAAATGQALQLAAVAGVSVYVAAGNSGSLDCFGLPPRSVDDPASQPYATAVGGTELFPGRSGAQREVVWNDGLFAGGGGVSRFWPMPAWQVDGGAVGPFSSGSSCGAVEGVCRQVPDVALNAATRSHGYIVFCAATGADCGGRGWMTVGGTSAAAPLHGRDHRGRERVLARKWRWPNGVRQSVSLRDSG